MTRKASLMWLLHLAHYRLNQGDGAGARHYLTLFWSKWEGAPASTKRRWRAGKGKDRFLITPDKETNS